MHRAGVLLAALALVVTGCSGSGGKPASPTTPADHAQASAQRALLTRALADFKQAPTGSYESQVTADGITQPTAHESGSYRLRPAAASYERAILGIDPTSQKARVQVVRVIGTPGAWFLQLKEWGSWTGCWMRTTVSEISRLTGVTIVRGSTLPTAVTILVKAKVVGAGGGLDGPHLAVDAYSALQFLGVAGAAIAGQRDALSRVQVPVLLDVTADGAPSGAAIEGTQVVDALAAAGVSVTQQLSKFVSRTHAKVRLSRLGGSVAVRSPQRRLLLPRHPAPDSTCPANR